MADLILISIRFALFANLMLIVGLAAFILYALDPAEREEGAMVTVVAWPQTWLCGAGLVLSFSGMAVLTANMQGVGIFAVDPAMVTQMVRDTDVGTAWLARMAALFIALAAARSVTARPTLSASLLAIAGSIALTTLVWSGHAGASEGTAGALHRINDALHMMAAAVWFGAIAAFILLMRPGPEPGSERLRCAARSLDQFARVGTICVLIIVATGLVNSQMIVGVQNIGRSAATPYGQLLLAKLGLFALMLALAAANRWRLTPALKVAIDEANPGAAIRAIRKSLILEGLAAASILALVAWLGTLEPVP
jgi:putative copper resistance protein D